jgi:small-conductance mechanosensitive channel
MTFLDWTLYDNAVRTWLWAALVAAVTYVGLRILKALVVRHFSRLVRRTRTDVDDIASDVLRNTRLFFLLFVSLYAGSRVLVLGESAENAVRIVVVVVTVVQAALWGEVIIGSVISRRTREALAQDAAEATTLNALGFITRLVLWSVLLLMGLANLGVEIGPALAGLGVGGIAVALALQNILGDLFASLSIVLDKPFVIGDFVVVGDLAGTVERVGLKTTRVRSLSGEQLVFSNADLLGSRIRNFKRMVERRVAFKVGVTYDTSYEQLTSIPDMIREIVELQEKARFDRSHFQAYADSSLDIETVYYVLDSDYNVYMDVQQAINLAIFRRFEDEGIAFAYPTRTLYLARAPAGGAPAQRAGSVGAVSTQ